MTDLLDAIKCLRSVFDKYAGKEGDPNTLTRKEVSELLRHELHITEDSAEMRNFFSLLDNDSDGVVAFEEYMTFVAALSVICGKHK